MDDDRKPTKGDVEAVAMRFLGRRDYGREELARKLRDRQLPPELIAEVLADYEEAGYLDDRRFATTQGEILARKCWGPLQIRHKLKSRGIDDAVVDEALAKIGDAAFWRGQAGERLQKKFGAATELSQNDKQRAYRHLTYRGFAPALVRQVLFDD